MNSPYWRIVWTVQESMKMRHGSASKGLVWRGLLRRGDSRFHRAIIARNESVAGERIETGKRALAATLGRGSKRPPQQTSFYRAARALLEMSQCDLQEPPARGGGMCRRN
jgi:hypothetical protein